MINENLQAQPRRPRVKRQVGSRPWRRSALVTSLLAAVGLALLAGPVSAAPIASAPRPVTTSYQNPLAPEIPGDGTVDSCADPTVIQGQDGETLNGQQVWYLYCTTDPLNDEDVDASGDPIFHRIPTMVSTDLVNWTYVGDAFPLDGGDIPAWIDPSAAFWAPDVVYSSATDQYYLFVTVTETTAAGGGSDTCRRRQRHRRRGRGQPHRSVGRSPTSRSSRRVSTPTAGSARTSGPSTRTSSATRSPTRASSTTARTTAACSPPR